MTVTTFDNARTACALEATSMERHQAEVIVEAMRDAATTDHDELATMGHLYRALWVRYAALIAIQLATTGPIISLLPFQPSSVSVCH